MSLPGYWTPLQLTANKRPVLIGSEPPEDGVTVEPEIELMIEKECSIYIGNIKTHKTGVLTITSHRILWVGNEAYALSLANVADLDSKAGVPGFSSPKITVNLKALPNQPPPDPSFMLLSFHGKGRDTFLSHIQSAMKSKLWEKVELPSEQPQDFTTRGAGIGGIIKKAKDNQARTDVAVTAAFKDLDALMANAKNIVVLAEKYAQSQEAQNHDASAASEFNAMLLDLGIASPVTKTAAGAAYHTQLSRQLADFIAVPLQRAGGMMTLTAAFCIFNRARGTELISPDDMMQACRLFSELGLPVRLRSLTTGFMVLQLESMSDEAFNKDILSLVQEKGKIGALELSRVRHVSVMLAKQRLMEAEEKGLLCRDEHFSGLDFYKNIFV